MKKQFIVFISIVAAMTMGIVGIIMYMGNSGSSLPEFPMLTVTGYAGQYKSFKIYMANDGTDLISSNPWSASADSLTLPVYRYSSVSTEKTKGEMVKDEEEEDELTPVYFFSYEEAEAIGEELKENYGKSLGMISPQVDIYGGTYNVKQERQFYVALYEGSDNLTNQVVNFSLDRAEFTTDKDGQIHIERKDILTSLVKVNDYPIISVEEAYNLLENGNYITTSLFGMAGVDYVARAELVYKADGYEEYVMPYYCFYVEIPELPGNGGMKTYATYYVPAVYKKYISNMPEWTGELK